MRFWWWVEDNMSKRQTDTDDRKSQSGLELNVIDHYDGSERSVKTLPAILRFSFALALGLSDEIQASAGGIQQCYCRWRIWFIDEGITGAGDESTEWSYGRQPSGGNHFPCTGIKSKDWETDCGDKGKSRRKQSGTRLTDLCRRRISCWDEAEHQWRWENSPKLEGEDDFYELFLQDWSRRK